MIGRRSQEDEEIQAMQDSYPGSNTYPYVMAALVAFAMVLAPPTEWPATVKKIHEYALVLVPVEHEEGAPRTPMVVEFDPLVKSRESGQPAGAVASSWTVTSGATGSTPLALDNLAVEDQTQHAASRAIPLPPISSVFRSEYGDPEDRYTGPLPVKYPRRSDTPLQSQNAADTIFASPELSSRPTAVEVNAAKTVGSSPPQRTPQAEPQIVRHVWTPPPNWVPRPIVPHNELVPAQPEPAVAKRVSRPDLERDIPDGIKPQPESPSADRAYPLLNVESLSAQPQLRESAEQPGIEVPRHEVPQQELPKEELPRKEEPAKLPIEEESSSPEQIRITDRSEDTPEPLAASISGVGDWPAMAALDELLEQAVRDRVLHDWANEITRARNLLLGSRMTGSQSEREAIARLRQLAEFRIDRSQWPYEHRVLHDRLRYAVLRRVDVWEPMMQIANDEPVALATYKVAQQTASAARTLASQLARDSAGPWANYLELDRITTSNFDLSTLRQQAEHVLQKLYSPEIDQRQLRYLESAGSREFESQLRTVIARSIHPTVVVSALEAYESQPDNERAAELVGLLARWRSSPEGNVYVPTINAVVTHYRNANIRWSVSEELINRFVPAFQQYAEAVHDTILGAAVRGRNNTRTNMSVHLFPDDQGIRLGLLASGRVHSNTTSWKGPVKMFNRGQSTFKAGKELLIKPDGIFQSPTETRASTGTRMIKMQTEWDSFPILGDIVRSIALQQHDEQKPFVRAEVLRRVHRSASQRMDQEVSQRLARAEESVGSRLVEPLRQLELNPQLLEMRTTENRAIMRSRLASSMQLAAHTPRPNALANSMLSVQIHHTAANNWIEQINVRNRRMTLDELMAALSKRFGTELTLPKEGYGDTIIQFAAEHPLEFEFVDGQIMLTIHLAELNTGKRKWRDFSVRGYYRADIRQLEVELVREEGIELLSDRFGLKDQIMLRSIFSKVLAKNTRFAILRDAIREQPQLRSLDVTQFTIRDGWLALALGERTETVHFVERPKTDSRRR